jgi:uncharacterized protein YdhG (YjbR/CyaY superfamily)
MAVSKPKNRAVSALINKYPAKVRKTLEKIRDTIRKSAPMADEIISYRLPAYNLEGRDLVYFGGFKDHISFFPTSSGISKFKKELSGYHTSTGTVSFGLDETIPFGLITKMVKFRVKEVKGAVKP